MMDEPKAPAFVDWDIAEPPGSWTLTSSVVFVGMAAFSCIATWLSSGLPPLPTIASQWSDGSTRKAPREYR